MRLREAMRRLGMLAAQERTRYAIDSVHVRRDGAEIVVEVTDGRRLVHLRYEDFAGDDIYRADGFRAVIGVDLWDYLCSVGASIDEKSSVDGTIVAHLGETDATVTFTRPLDSLPTIRPFPDVRNILDEASGEDLVRLPKLNGRILRELLEALDGLWELEESPPAVEILFSRRDGRPVHILVESSMRPGLAHAAIMPVAV